MTIHQLKSPCWELQDPAGDRTPHYDDEASAAAELASLRKDTPDTGAKVRQLAAPCWLIRCDGECDQLIDEEDECYIVHCESRQAAGELARAWKWAYSGDGRLIFCKADAPADGEVPQLSPAEQEAAGQLVIPGVLP